jgi:hypothetical protein
MHKWPQGLCNYTTCYYTNNIQLEKPTLGYTETLCIVTKHKCSASVQATNIPTCNLYPLRGVVPDRARNGYRPRQVLVSVFTLLSKHKQILCITALVQRLSKEMAILGIYNIKVNNMITTGPQGLYNPTTCIDITLINNINTTYIPRTPTDRRTLQW